MAEPEKKVRDEVEDKRREAERKERKAAIEVLAKAPRSKGKRISPMRRGVRIVLRRMRRGRSK